MITTKKRQNRSDNTLPRAKEPTALPSEDLAADAAEAAAAAAAAAAAETAIALEAWALRFRLASTLAAFAALASRRACFAAMKSCVQ